jgi:hypothetical protein
MGTMLTVVLWFNVVMVLVLAGLPIKRIIRAWRGGAG